MKCSIIDEMQHDAASHLSIQFTKVPIWGFPEYKCLMINVLDLIISIALWTKCSIFQNSFLLKKMLDFKPQNMILFNKPPPPPKKKGKKMLIIKPNPDLHVCLIIR